MTPAVQPLLEKPHATHHCGDLIMLFQRCFATAYRTRLVGGGAEPEYLPAGAGADDARIIFTRDYFASALHEVAHWCVAGPQRRLLPDYGYWYAADGRTVEQQQAFEQVEVKPQALEWVFAEAAGFRFRVSADNLAQGLGPSDEFKRAIAAQAQHYLANGLPSRAQTFTDALLDHYSKRVSPVMFSRLPD